MDGHLQVAPHYGSARMFNAKIELFDRYATSCSCAVLPEKRRSRDGNMWTKNGYMLPKILKMLENNGVIFEIVWISIFTLTDTLKNTGVLRKLIANKL